MVGLGQGAAKGAKQGGLLLPLPILGTMKRIAFDKKIRPRFAINVLDGVLVGCKITIVIIGHTYGGSNL